MATVPVPGPDPPLSAQESPVGSPVLAATRAKAVAAAKQFLGLEASKQDPEQAAREQQLRKNFEKKQANIAQNAAIAARNAANRERRAALEAARKGVAGSRAPYLYTSNIKNKLANNKAIAEAARIMGGKRTRKNRNRKNHKRKTHKRR